MIPTYIPRLKGSPDVIISSLTLEYIGVTMVTPVIMSIIVGDIPIVVIYLKKMIGFYKKKLGTWKTRRCV
jgi:hypothetical protein